MTLSLRERIYAIVIQAEVDGLGNKLVSKILLAVKEAMPEKAQAQTFDASDPSKWGGDYHKLLMNYVGGFNRAIEEMEKRCE